MINGGEFDLKGLAEAGVRHGLSRVDDKTSFLMSFADDIVGLVGPGLELAGIPHTLKLSKGEAAVGKILVNMIVNSRRRIGDGNSNQSESAT